MPSVRNLTLACLAAAALVAGTYAVTSSRILANETAWGQRQLLALVPAGATLTSVNDDRHEWASKDGRSGSIYRGRTARAYNGPIEFWIAVDGDGAYRGLRVIAHTETPGIADFIEPGRSDWFAQFEDGTLANTWQLRRDGGDFDHVSGATVTSRAITRGIGLALEEEEGP